MNMVARDVGVIGRDAYDGLSAHPDIHRRATPVPSDPAAAPGSWVPDTGRPFRKRP